MQTIWYQYRNPTGFTASALFINLGFETADPIADPLHSDKVYMQTMGSNIGFKNDSGRSWEQHTTKQAPTGLTKSKCLHAGTAGVIHSPRFSLYGGTEFHGQDPDSEKVTRMDLLYRSNHSFMGSMDYFKGYDYYGVGQVSGPTLESRQEAGS